MTLLADKKKLDPISFVSYSSFPSKLRRYVDDPSRPPPFPFQIFLHVIVLPGLSISSLTGSPEMPFSPGILVLPPSTPTSVKPESEATGASPGACPSLCAGALGAPRP